MAHDTIFRAMLQAKKITRDTANICLVHFYYNLLNMQFSIKKIVPYAVAFRSSIAYKT